MRIRLFHAFASNNSGSYTLVGSFGDEATAEAVARLVQEVSDAHTAWCYAQPGARPDDSPLDVLARRLGLAADAPGRGEEWPEHGPKPSAVAAGSQVIVHAPYTVTLPALFGALFYVKGGRVEAELDHAHEALAVQLGYWPTGKARLDEAVPALLDAFEEHVKAELPALLVGAEHDQRPSVAPAWPRGDGWARSLWVIFPDLVRGVTAVRRLAGEHGMTTTVRISESPPGVLDPFAMLRGRPIPWGRYRVILWQVGADRISAMKAVREALGSGLTDAKAALEDLPREILVDVGEEHARSAVEALVRAGCDAEVVVPAAR
jgi:hypothetical protein